MPYVRRFGRPMSEWLWLFRAHWRIASVNGCMRAPALPSCRWPFLDALGWFLSPGAFIDRKSTRLNSSHVAISYAVFCLKRFSASLDLHSFPTRRSSDLMSLMNAVRQAVWATDVGVALALPGALEDRISQRLYAGPRFAFLPMAIFGCLGLVLVTGGVY